jgi:hypothetical protein
MKAQISIHRCVVKYLMRLLALLLLLAAAPPMLFAQEWDHLNGRDKVHDPIGAWLIKNDNDGPNPPVFILNVFHQGGTLTGDLQGEGAFVPGVKPPESVINSPESGVWQKTGWNTFAVTFLTMEYDSNPPSLLFHFDKVQYTGFLYESGDRMEITELVITNYDPKGVMIGQPNRLPFKFHGARIPLELLPSTAPCLPIR